jgi:hypothetical protein
MKQKYFVHTRSEPGRKWVWVEDSATLVGARKKIEELRAMGGVWANNEYLISDSQHPLIEQEATVRP